jgi:hypothetical protein
MEGASLLDIMGCNTISQKEEATFDGIVSANGCTRNSVAGTDGTGLANATWRL